MVVAGEPIRGVPAPREVTWADVPTFAEALEDLGERVELVQHPLTGAVGWLRRPGYRWRVMEPCELLVDLAQRPATEGGLLCVQQRRGVIEKRAQVREAVQFVAAHANAGLQ